MDGPLADAFSQASGFLVAAVTLVPSSEWDAPGLGSWNLRELVGHANRGQTTVVDYLIRPQPPQPRGSSYFDEAAIAERGRQAVADLGVDIAATIATTSGQVTELVGRTPPEATIGSPAGTMTLRDYLPSRIAELTIHGLDVVRAIGGQLGAPRAAMEQSLAFVTQRSLRRGDAEVVLLALTGRDVLPAGYSAY